MTSGEAVGTSGEGGAYLDRLGRIYIAVALLVGLSCAVNIGSVLIENPPDERHFKLWEPFVWETSSAGMTLAGLWAWVLIYYRFPLARVGRWRFVAMQLGGFLGYTLSHVGGMVALRELAYALDGRDYDFSQGDLWLRVIYEARKDALGYLLMLAIIWVDDRFSRQAQVAPSARRKLEIRDGGRTVFVDPAEVLWIEAAGNYVEVHTADKVWLTRGVLTAWEAQLAEAGFLRVHRSRLVNRQHIQAIEPVPSGDVRIRLTDDRQIVGSRRYKAAL
ncbi:LytTR family DNA-binding domain-containing protein [Asticcacaulis sp.]|uniref:LytTR family DNA-binding domain-containing protein n=1 Tax=Asticcacaulis sp. TaxID=1872648 RepID=UPI00260184CF|nr:LytTR family DNA-binding domain-containing protein [Asticcacaulis sp.]